MTVPCDGCEQEFEMGQLAFVGDYGHECRYCRECHEEYDTFIKAVVGQEMLLQRALDNWQLMTRKSLRLKRVPMDFPPIQRKPGVPTILG